MAVVTKIDPINRDIELLINDGLSGQARSEFLAEYAAEQIEEARRINAAAIGRDPDYVVTVDGHKNAPLISVRPDGVVVAEFNLVTDLLGWIGEQLVLHSPVGGSDDPHAGLYSQSHVLYADGEAVEPGSIPEAQEYVFLNALPYARRIELGSSSQAPDGVYQAIATLAARRFGNVAKVSFSYRAPFAGGIASGRAGNKSEGRYPAIVVRTGGG